MARYEDAGDEVITMLDNIKESYFPELRAAKFKVFFDTKKKTSGGKFVLARISKTNDLQRYLTVDESGSDFGYDYFLYLDLLVWYNSTEADQSKILQHELFHTLVDMEKDNPYGIQGHEVETFYDEIERCKDDSRWAERLSAVAESLYEREKNRK